MRHGLAGERDVNHSLAIGVRGLRLALSTKAGAAGRNSTFRRRENTVTPIGTSKAHL